MLILVEHVADEGAERLHRDIERRIEQSQQYSRREKPGRVAQADQRHRQHRTAPVKKCTKGRPDRPLVRSL
ncbi:hypothetical protein [Sphingomonas sp. RS2018]